MPGGDVIVIGGGYSARGVDFGSLWGTVIGVNDAALLAPVDLAVSMDRLWTEGRWADLVRLGIPAYIRRNALQNIEPAVQAAALWLHPFECDHTSVEMSPDLAVLNGTHSGLCALNLAYILAPARVILVGFDLSLGPYGERHWYPPYPWALQGGTSRGKFKQWAGQLAGPAAQFLAAGIDVVNVSDSTAVRNFPRVAVARFESLRPHV